MKKLKNELGRTMVEMLGVIAIMGLIMYGAVAGIGFGLDMYKISATHTEVEELARGIIELYSWSRSYDNLSNTVVCENDLIDCVQSGGVKQPRSRFNGVVDVTPTNDGQGFVIHYGSIPNLACNRLKVMSYTYFSQVSGTDTVEKMDEGGNGTGEYENVMNLGTTVRCDSDSNDLYFAYHN